MTRPNRGAWVGATVLTLAVLSSGGLPTEHTATATPVEAVQGSMLPPEYLAAMEHADQRGIEVWDAVADCESGQWDRHGHPIRGSADWGSTKGFYEGGVQFSHATWVAAGGRKYAEHAYQASRTEQIDIADH